MTWYDKFNIDEFVKNCINNGESAKIDLKIQRNTSGIVNSAIYYAVKQMGEGYTSNLLEFSDGGKGRGVKHAGKQVGTFIMTVGWNKDEVFLKYNPFVPRPARECKITEVKKSNSWYTEKLTGRTVYLQPMYDEERLKEFVKGCIKNNDGGSRMEIRMRKNIDNPYLDIIDAIKDAGCTHRGVWIHESKYEEYAKHYVLVLDAEGKSLGEFRKNYGNTEGDWPSFETIIVEYVSYIPKSNNGNCAVCGLQIPQ